MSVAISDEVAASIWKDCLPFERPLAELQAKLESADEKDRRKIQRQLDKKRRNIYAKLTAWERVQLARHPMRPHMMDYVKFLFDDFIELHGDRLSGDDPAMVGGFARYRGETVVVVGQEKGATTDEKVACNFGMAHPEGYRKALRIFQLAEKFKLPVITFVDTPAAHPGIEAEEGGQGPAIATNLLAMAQLKTPILSVVIGEGGSGGALGIAVGDHISMLEHAIYVICPPESCAEILWRDRDKKELAASVMRVTSKDLLGLKVIDSIIEEANGGAHRDPKSTADALAAEIDMFMAGCKEGRWTPKARQEKFQSMGAWRE
jgi:acetyl-CoA carboxylase carboxyl transferase subunit alpha